MLLSLVLLGGCGQSSVVTPLFPAISVSEQQGRKDGLSAFTAQYTLAESVDSPTQIKLPIGKVFNGIFNQLTNGLGNLILNMQTKRDVEIDAIEFEIPQDSIDYDLVRELVITDITFMVKDESLDPEKTFQFIEKIQIFIPNVNEKGMDRRELETQTDSLLGEYNVKDRSFRCQATRKCIEFKVKPTNIVHLTKYNEKLFLKVYILVGKVPRKTFEITGTIGVAVKLKLPF